MGILILFSSSDIGGAEASLTRLAAKSYADTYYVASVKGVGAWEKFAQNLGLKPIIFGHNYSKILSILLFWLPYFRLNKYLRNNPIEIIYVIGFKTAFWVRIFKIFMPKFQLVHGIRWNPDTSLMRDKVFRFIERNMSSSVDYFITNSEAAKKVLLDKCNIPLTKIEVIYNGIDTEDSKLPIPFSDKEDSICTVANLAPRKGFIEFLNVIKKVLEKKPNTLFYFVGRDDMNGKVQEEILKQGLSKSVIYKGYLENIPSWVRKIKIFVLPSLHSEGCPTSILEAMTVGTPAIG
jgi:glycosyltransferase involved in cell wall biosynthesis